MIRFYSRALVAASALTAALAAASAASAQSNWAATGGVGSDGVGVGLLYKVTPHIVLSGRLAAGPDYSTSGESFGFKVTGHTNLGGATAAVELHPWASGSLSPAFVAAGVFHGFDRDVPLKATYTAAPIVVSGISVGGPQIGRVTGKGKVDATIPVIGVGWDNTFTTSSRWGYRLFGGVGFGDAKVTSLAASGGAYSDHAQVKSAVKALAYGVEHSDKFDLLRTYPVASASVTYKF